MDVRERERIYLFRIFYARHRLGMSLAKQKESLIRDRDRLSAEVTELNKLLHHQSEQIEVFEAKRIEYEEKCRELYKSLDVKFVVG